MAEAHRFGCRTSTLLPGTLTGEPKKVTTISTEASGGTWSPDGKSVLFVSSVFPDCKDDACNKQRDEERAKSKVKARTYDHLMFRHWTHYDNGKRSHLFIVPIEGGVARDLTPGDYDVPPFSLGGQDQYAFSPDGKEVAYTCNTDQVQATSTNSDVFRCAERRRNREEDHHQSRQRQHGNLFSRWQVHCLPLAVSRRLRERPLPPDAV